MIGAHLTANEQSCNRRVWFSPWVKCMGLVDEIGLSLSVLKGTICVRKSQRTSIAVLVT